MTQPAISGPAWDLSDEYAGVDDEALQQDLDQIDQLLDEVEALNPGLSGDDAVSTAQQIVKLADETNKLLGNISTFAHCLLSVDSQHEAAQQLSGRLLNYRKRCGDLFEPFSQFIDAADEDTVTAYLCR